jgi:hypothetical protein
VRETTKIPAPKYGNPEKSLKKQPAKKDCSDGLRKTAYRIFWNAPGGADEQPIAMARRLARQPADPQA